MLFSTLDWRARTGFNIRVPGWRGSVSLISENSTMSVVPDPNEPTRVGDRTPPERAHDRTPTGLADPGDPTVVPRLKAPLYAIAAALVAAFLAWAIGEQTHELYRPSAKAQQSAREFTALNRETRIADQKNTAIVYGAFGAVLGLFSGAAGGALRRSIPGGASSALAGLLLGGIGGALAGYAIFPIFARFYSDETQSLLLSFLARGAICAVIGIAAGAAFGWGWRGPVGMSRSLFGGLAGSVCGAIAFEAVNAVLFSADRNDAIIPSSMQARLLACVFVSVGAAIGTVLLARGFAARRQWTVDSRQ
jgi:hypothetical protein